MQVKILQTAQSMRLSLHFLNAVLAKQPLSGAVGLQEALHRLHLGDGHQGHAGWRAPGPLAGSGEISPHPRQILCNRHTLLDAFAQDRVLVARRVQHREDLRYRSAQK